MKRYGLYLLLVLMSSCNSKGQAPQIVSETTASAKAWKRPIPMEIDESKDKLDTLLKTNHFLFISHNEAISKIEVKNIADICEENIEAMKRFADNRQQVALMKYHIYPSIEQKALRKKNIKTASIDRGSNSIYTVHNKHFKGSQLQAENQLILSQLLPNPSLPVLADGLSIHFTKEWQKKGYTYWCGLLYQSNNLPPLSELLNNDIYQKESYLVKGAMSGVFIDFLLNHFGKAVFLKKYTIWSITELANLEANWNTYLSKQFSNFQAIPLPKIPANTYLKGFNFAHEGYRIYNGYGSQLAKQSLTKLESIGSNTVAIVPYSFMRDPKKASELLIEHRDGGENDESVLFSHFEAQDLGMHTMLKPQIWIRGSWPGDVAMKTDAEWATFFDNYYRWVRHYALLAEINGFDSFCIGVEFAKATLTKEKEWRHLIRQIKNIYSGPITYAANWGDEFEKMNFWEELDFIGINCYYPLSPKENPSKRELQKAFKKVMTTIEKVAQKHNKSVVFTEIGFRSVESTWANPHEEHKGRAFNETTQALAYEVVFECIKNKPWCSGILWWKWPSYLTHRGGNNKGFTPANKQAELVVQKWFQE